MSFSSFFSSLLTVVHADAAEETEEIVASTQVEEVEQAEEEVEEPEDVGATNTIFSFHCSCFRLSVTSRNSRRMQKLGQMRNSDATL